MHDELERKLSRVELTNKGNSISTAANREIKMEPLSKAYFKPKFVSIVQLSNILLISGLGIIVGWGVGGGRGQFGEMACLPMV